jgi:SHOCT-like protein
MADALDRVLKLVADGRLTAAEAAPILDALSAKGGRAPEGEAPFEATSEGSNGESRPARYARIQVIEGGRRAVDLRVPISLGKLALARVPGLSGPQLNDVQSAIESGSRGPILDIQDSDGDGVRIVLE